MIFSGPKKRPAMRHTFGDAHGASALCEALGPSLVSAPLAAHFLDSPRNHPSHACVGRYVGDVSTDRWLEPSPITITSVIYCLGSRRQRSATKPPSLPPCGCAADTSISGSKRLLPGGMDEQQTATLLVKLLSEYVGAYKIRLVTCLVCRPVPPSSV